MSKPKPLNVSAIVVRIVVQHENACLVLRRAADQTRPGEWEIPGGNLDAGENIEEAGKRELLEETGIAVTDLQYLQSDWYEVDGKPRIGAIFTAKASNRQVTLSDENDAYEWIDKSTFNNISVNVNHKPVLQKILFTEVNDSKHKHDDVKMSAKNDHLVVYTDGGSRGNPGPSATGYVIMNENDEVLEDGGEYIGITTNNQAEYQAVKLGLKQAAKFSPKHLDFFIDSLLVVNQMNGEFAIKNKDLWPIHEAIKDLSQQYERVTYTHVKREHNTLADQQVNDVLDSYDHSNK